MVANSRRVSAEQGPMETEEMETGTETETEKEMELVKVVGQGETHHVAGNGRQRMRRKCLVVKKATWR